MGRVFLMNKVSRIGPDSDSYSGRTFSSRAAGLSMQRGLPDLSHLLFGSATTIVRFLHTSAAGVFMRKLHFVPQIGVARTAW